MDAMDRGDPTELAKIIQKELWKHRLDRRRNLNKHGPKPRRKSTTKPTNTNLNPTETQCN
jgi:hypothetical protein